MNYQQTTKFHDCMIECAIHMAREMVTYGTQHEEPNVQWDCFEHWLLEGNNRIILGETILAMPGIEERIVDNFVDCLHDLFVDVDGGTVWADNKLNDVEKLTVRRITMDMVNAD
ncbi:MAG: hypothetical protein F4W95_07120 [Chloroflexi bacterium]|nr:hypothetical protein [Chloroflexota bacterium]MYD48241.1 hypothetical protein [Chloroflexota bacterium]